MCVDMFEEGAVVCVDGVLVFCWGWGELDVLWKALVLIRGPVAVLNVWLVGAGKASKQALEAVDSFVMNALAASGIPRAGRREESSVRRAAEENVVTVVLNACWLFVVRLLWYGMNYTPVL